MSNVPIEVYVNGNKLAEYTLSALQITPIVGVKVVPQTLTVPLGLSSEVFVELLNPYPETLTVTLGPKTVAIPPSAVTLYPVTVTPLAKFNGTAYVPVTYLGRTLTVGTLTYYFVMPYSVSPTKLPYLRGATVVVPLKVINTLSDVVVPLRVVEGTTKLTSATLLRVTTITLPIFTSPIALEFGNWKAYLRLSTVTPNVTMTPRFTTVTAPLGSGYKVVFTLINYDPWTYVITGYVNSEVLGRALIVPGKNFITLTGTMKTTTAVNSLELRVGGVDLYGVIMAIPTIPVTVEGLYAGEVYSYLPATLSVVISKSVRSPVTLLLSLDGSSTEVTMLSNRTTVTFEKTFTKATYVTLLVMSSTYTLLRSLSYVTPLEPLSIVPKYAEGYVGVSLTIPITIINLANTSYYFTLSISGAYDDWYGVSLRPSTTLSTSILILPTTTGCNDIYFIACFPSGCTTLTSTCYFVDIPRPIVLTTPTVIIKGIGSNTTLLVLSNPFPKRMVVTLIGDKHLSFPTSVITLEPYAKVAIPVTGTLRYYGHVTATVVVTNTMGTLTVILMKIVAILPNGRGFEGVIALIMLAYAITRIAERL